MSQIAPEPYQQGYEAYEDGLKLKHNPYSQGPRFRKWNNGWYAARNKAVAGATA